MMSAFIATLSEEARYFRFKKQFQVASERLQHFLVDVDNMRHVALVCTIERDGREEEIGEARYVVNPDDRSCEFGIAIADAWQGTGLAGRLMGALEELARARGLQSIEGFVASVNRKMLRFMRARGYDVCADPHDPHSVRVVKPLA
jgi:acetyltransferase